MTKKKETTTETVKKDKPIKNVEQSVWSVKINSQLLYKRAVDGRTILLGMTADENKKVAEVLDQAIDDIAKVLEKRTTMHEAPAEKEQITRVDITKPENNGVKEVVEKEESSDSEELEEKEEDKKKVVKTKTTAKTSQKPPQKDKKTGKKKEGSWNSIFNKLRS